MADPEFEGAPGRGGTTAGRYERLEARLGALELAVADIRRRHVLAEIRLNPGRLLGGLAGARRIVRDDIDDLADMLARWEAPLSPDELAALQRAALVAHAVTGPQASKIYLVVVDVVLELTESDVIRAVDVAGILSARSRRAVSVVVALAAPDPDLERRAAKHGVEIVVDG